MDATIRVEADSVVRFHVVSMKQSPLPHCVCHTTDRVPDDLGYSRRTFLCGPRKDYIGTMHSMLRVDLRSCS